MMLNLTQPIVIAAAARLGRTFLKGLRREGIEPVAFIDNAEAKWGTTVDGIAVLSPEQGRAAFPQATVLVASLLVEYEIWRQATDLGFEKVYTVSQLHRERPDLFISPNLDGAWDSWEKAPRIAWADAESVEVYEAILEYRRTQHVANYARVRSNHPQYFPPGIVSLSSNDVICDVGAFTGDTLDSFRTLHPSYTPRYYAFEPDPANYERLLATGAQYSGAFLPVNSGIGAVEGVVSFHPHGTGDAYFGPGGEISVPVHTIDGFFANREAPTFIKMDIEGMEPDALRGAERTIRQHRPTLAICVYHFPNHLWSIPETIRLWWPNVRLFLRHYSNSLPETVMYAIPG